MAESSQGVSFQGRRIGIPESRQLDLFADMLERRGARVYRCPLVDIRDSPDSDGVNAWIDDVIAHGLDDMIWLTGEGVRRLTDLAGREDARRLTRLIERFDGARAITRGPKPGRELRGYGLGSDLSATTPTTAGVIDALAGETLAGRRMGVQLYGTDPNRPLMDFLAARGAHALPVAPYVYADEAEEPQVLAFVERLVAGELDAVAFTSSPQVKRLLKVASRHDRHHALVAAMNRLCVAAVGPLVAERLREAGIHVTLMPTDNYFMKPLVRALLAHFASPASAHLQ
ncbi:uroporphyrinogen-III synthase [Salinisphaera sp. T31B1]|uniref:uroporphyrinogen-III synthase n=1 Tax=Salinisphaera sp. T31B1 TaxID=727963 RepID=UPI003342B3C7